MSARDSSGLAAGTATVGGALMQPDSTAAQQAMTAVNTREKCRVAGPHAIYACDGDTRVPWHGLTFYQLAHFSCNVAAIFPRAARMAGRSPPESPSVAASAIALATRPGDTLSE